MIPESENEKEPTSVQNNKSGCLAVVALIGLLLFPLLFATVAFRDNIAEWLNSGWTSIAQQGTPTEAELAARELVKERFPAVIGLPFAAALSFVLVIVLRVGSGPIEFEGLGVKVRGATGPILLWVVCFLAITAAIKLLW